MWGPKETKKVGITLEQFLKAVERKVPKKK